MIYQDILGGDIAQYGRGETQGLTINYGPTWNGRQFHGVHPDSMETNGPPCRGVTPRAAWDMANFFGRGVCMNPPSPSRIEAWTPFTYLVHNFLQLSGPPSLESLSKLKSEYEASISSSPDTE